MLSYYLCFVDVRNYNNLLMYNQKYSFAMNTFRKIIHSQ